MGKTLPLIFFGGTFNPPHTGHVKLISFILNSMEAEKVYVVPSYSPPHKQEDLADFEIRFEMTRMIFRDLEKTGKVIVSDLERNLETPSYTYRSLKELAKQNPGKTIYPVLGMDMYNNLSQWMNYRELREEYRYIVLKRKDTDVIETMEGDKILDNPYWDISSRQLREFIREYYSNPREKLEKLLTEHLTHEVMDYIASRNLYNHD